MPKRSTTEPRQDRQPAILAPAEFGGYPGPLRRPVPGNTLLRLLATTDAKQIGLLYLSTSFFFFIAAGIEALLMRAELARPELQFLSPEQYNQLFTSHGTIMMFLFATPLAFAFGNYLVPLQIGAPDVSFPRLNALAYWLYLFGGLIVLGSFASPGGAADFGWTAYTPLSQSQHTPGVGANAWIIGLVLSGIGTILGSVNLITTVITLRAPGMTMWRLPLFTWAMFITTLMAIVVFPLLSAALLGLLSDRLLSSHVYDASQLSQEVHRGTHSRDSAADQGPRRRRDQAGLGRVAHVRRVWTGHDRGSHWRGTRPARVGPAGQGDAPPQDPRPDHGVGRRFVEHHALLARLHLDHIDHLNMIGRLDHQIERLIVPFAPQVQLLKGIPGIGERAAQAIISEIGVDMGWFPAPRTWPPGPRCVQATTNPQANAPPARPARATWTSAAYWSKPPGPRFEPGPTSAPGSVAYTAASARTERTRQPSPWPTTSWSSCGTS